jgi:phage I-like protein
MQSGLADTSPEYFSYLDARLADLAAQQPAATASHLVQEMQQRAAQDRPQEQARPTRLSPAHVSAPVSREVPSASGLRSPGRVTLTAQQREAAKMSGVSEAEYARQLLRLRELQASGEYSDRR